MSRKDRKGRGVFLIASSESWISVCFAGCLPCHTLQIRKEERPPREPLPSTQERSQTHVMRQTVEIQAHPEPQAMNSRKHHHCIFIGVALTVWCFSTSTTLAEDMKGLFVSTSPIDSGRQMLIVIDPEQQVLAVYHIKTVSGEVSLLSTRALGYDLQLEDFNAKDPKPAAIKKMLRIDSAPKPPSNTIEIIPPAAQRAK